MSSGAGDQSDKYKDKPKAVELYEKVESEIKGLKDSVDTTEAEELLKKVRLAIDIKDYSSAEEYVKECIQKTHELKKAYETAADSLKTAWPRIKAAREGGKDVSRSDELIKEARKALRAKQPEKSMQLSVLAVDLLLSPEERKKKKAEETRERIKSTMEAVNTFGEIKGVGLLLVHEAESLISRADRAFENGKYDEASQLYKKSEKSLNQLKEQYLYKQAEDIFEQVESMVNELEEAGKSVPGTSMSLLKAKDAYEYEDYDELIFQSIKIKNAIEKWEEEKSDEDAIQVISKGQFLLADLRKTDMDIDYLEEQFKDAKTALDDKDYAKAEELGRKVVKDAKELLKERNKEKAEELMGEINEGLAELREGDVDLSKIEGELLKAQNTFQSEDYKESIRTLKKLGPRISRAKKKALVPKMEKAIEEAKEAIEEAKKEGINVLEPENWLRQAKFAFDNKNYEEVKNLTDKIHDRLEKGEEEKLEKAKEEKAKEEKKKVEYKRLIPEAMKALQKLREQKWDVRPLVQKLKKAPALLKNKKYDELKEVTNEVKDDATDILKNEIIKPATALLQEAEREIKDSVEKGLDVGESKEGLEKAKKHLSDKKYYLVKEKIEEVMDKLKAEAEKVSIHKAEIIIEFSKGIIDAYEEWGLDTADFQELLEEGGKALKEKDVDKATAISRKLEKGLEESRALFLEKQAKKALSEAETFLKEKKGDEADEEKAKRAEKLQEEARKGLEESEYIKAWFNALESNKEAGMKDEELFKLKCDMIETIFLPKMVELRNTNLDIEAVETEFNKYKKLYEEEKYEEAHELLSQVADDAHRLEERYITSNALGFFEDILKDYEAVGVETGELRELLLDARSELDEQEFVKALTMVKDALDIAEEHKESVLENFSVDDRKCPSCSYSIIVFEPNSTSDLTCPICENNFGLETETDIVEESPGTEGEMI